MYRVALALAAPVAALFMSVFASQPAKALEAYIFRGAGDFSFIGEGLTFSNGMDRLADQLQDSGIRSRVYRWELGDAAYREIMSRKPDAVALMGHSMGALTSLTLAQRLKGSGIRVAYIGLIDIPGPVGATPSNVEWAENFYHAYPVFGMLTTSAGHKGYVSNEYIFGEVHITMDKSDRIHNAMISAIWQADAKGRNPTMHAYAGEQRPAGTLERVDRVLSASADPTVTASVSTHAPQRRQGTATGLPPIE